MITIAARSVLRMRLIFARRSCRAKSLNEKGPLDASPSRFCFRISGLLLLVLGLALLDDFRLRSAGNRDSAFGGRFCNLGTRERHANDHPLRIFENLDALGELQVRDAEIVVG